ncbi:galectin-8-like [Corythoichthys intestinalis]|uniref:galectin-8-like n=1 Tax=Corythoichthys intestinalis TaxID=161448 RepID=UPI0025A5272C|nr:galectin-8-like [Corythoichthys intestinalis]XP_061806606.1 galectin-8-like [Nerophis lumbriciformis]
MSTCQSRQTFVKPAVPFSWTIRGGLLPGETILVEGRLPSGADRFQVDLTCGSSVSPRADVLFHFNPRVKKGHVVCNTLQEGRWGQEEILQRMPFAGNADFELVILVFSDRFKVALNGAHLLEYKHRLPLERADTLAISGKVQIHAVAVLPSAASVPALLPTDERSEKELRPLVMSADQRGGFRGELIGGLRPNVAVVIRGQAHQEAESFAANLLLDGGSGTALHFNPRFKSKVMVLNSFLSGSWGDEERQGEHFPFGPGLYFEVIIRCEADRFRVAVNGVHRLDYKYRVRDLRSITGVRVTGDLSLTDVCLM